MFIANSGSIGHYRRESLTMFADSQWRNKMLKTLAAIGLGAALILAPVATMAQTAAPAPAAMPAKPVVHHKVVHHKVVHHKMVHHKMVHHKVVHHKVKPMAKKPMPAPAPAATPQG